MKKICLLLFFFIFTTQLFSQKITIEEYIAAYKDIAMKEMMRSGVPASITLAQGILETDYGNSPLVKKSNNHFGIKCKETWTGPSVSHDDDAPQECFRKYDNAIASYIDHSDFLRTRKHYHFLFDLDPLDYKAWAHGLKKAGYATNPKYPQILIKYIETYRLNDYSLIAMGKTPSTQTELAQIEAVKPIDPPLSSLADKVKSSEEVVVVAINPATTKSSKPVNVDNTPPVKSVANTKTEVREVKASESGINKTAAISDHITSNKSSSEAYPAGEFKINETRVIYAQAGTSLLSIATGYSLPLKYIYDFNDFSEEKELLEKPQLIFLQRKRRVGVSDHHIVSEGETLYDIAQKQGIRLEALLQLNHLTNEQTPAIGEKLYLQNAAPTSPAVIVADMSANKVQAHLNAEATEEGDYEVYVVQPKETLYGISKRFNISIQELTEWNNLAGTDIKEGMELIVTKKDYDVFKSSR